MFYTQKKKVIQVKNTVFITTDYISCKQGKAMQQCATRTKTCPTLPDTEFIHYCPPLCDDECVVTFGGGAYIINVAIAHSKHL